MDAETGKMLQDDIEKARKEGYIVLCANPENPMLLSVLIQFAQSVFPNHTLEQLAITELDSDEDSFVLAAESNIKTQAN